MPALGGGEWFPNAPPRVVTDDLEVVVDAFVSIVEILGTGATSVEEGGEWGVRSGELAGHSELMGWLQ